MNVEGTIVDILLGVLVMFLGLMAVSNRRLIVENAGKMEAAQLGQQNAEMELSYHKISVELSQRVAVLEAQNKEIQKEYRSLEQKVELLTRENLNLITVLKLSGIEYYGLYTGEGGSGNR